MITLWGNADSVNVQKVLWCLEELGLAYRRIDAGRHYGVVDTPDFLARNPNGLVPTIDDDGFVLWESNAIVRYLAARHAAGSLWPADVRVRAIADQWMDWTASTLWPTLVPLFRAIMRTPMPERDVVAIRRLTDDAVPVIEILDRHLASHPFIAGDTFTMGDVAAGCPIWRWYALPLQRPAFAHVQQWFDALAARKAYRDVVMPPLST